MKQVQRCLQRERQLTKGSWPGLLTEASFHINAMENASSRVSPHVLHMGREPRSPLEAWCTNLSDGERNTHGEYLETTRKAGRAKEHRPGEHKKKSRKGEGTQESEQTRERPGGRRQSDVEEGAGTRFVDIEIRRAVRGLAKERTRRETAVRKEGEMGHMDNVKKYTGPASSIVHKGYAEHVITLDPKREERDTTASEEFEQGEEFEIYSEEEGQFVKKAYFKE